MTLQEILWKNKEVTPISIRSKSGKLHLYVKKYIGRTGVVQGEAKNGMLRIRFKSKFSSHDRNIPAGCLIEIES